MHRSGVAYPNKTIIYTDVGGVQVGILDRKP
jgi:hypothetical protein